MSSTAAVAKLKAERDRLRLALLFAYSNMPYEIQWRIAFTKDKMPKLSKNVAVGTIIRSALGHKRHKWDARKKDVALAWKELELLAATLDNQEDDE